MRGLVIDVETTVQRVDGRTDNSPYNPLNKLVSVGCLPINDDLTLGEASYFFFHHTEYSRVPTVLAEDMHQIQEMIDEAPVLVAHNAKFDCAWMTASGFNLEGKSVQDTMISEYILSRGQKIPLSLKESADRRGVQAKKSDLIDGYWKDGIGFEEMPMDVVREYGIGDIVTTGELFLVHQELFSNDRNKGLVKVRDMMNEFCAVLTEMERNGIAIDIDALDAVEKEFIAEKETLEIKLHEMACKLMGDRPYKLSSPEQLSSIVYSRKVNDKDAWGKTFNLGKDARGKDLRRPKMTIEQFRKAVKGGTERVYKEKASQCPACTGLGKVYRIKKDGSRFANPNNCKDCGATGIVYTATDKVAGLKFNPRDIEDVSNGGFSTDKTTLSALVSAAKLKGGMDEATEFLEAIIRLNAVETYLASFVGGIRRGVIRGIIHPSFNQCVTATGRLSSSNPNFQNMPRGGTFPIKKCIVSRFHGGKIIEADFSGLEFRGAAQLSGCDNATQHILDDKDIHKQTASIIFQKPEAEVTKDERQMAKPFTFAPTYGGMGMGEPPHIKAYFDAFFDVYPGIKSWHIKLMEGVIKTKKVVLPSGREYMWPQAERTRWGGCSYATQIKNYPVQGHSTADVVPLAVIRVARLLKQRGLAAILVNTVHDSVVVDCPATEVNEVLLVLAEAMLDLPEEFSYRFGYTLTVPLAMEAKVGDNWLKGEEFKIKSVNDLRERLHAT